jgi:CHAT domain-containing protein
MPKKRIIYILIFIFSCFLTLVIGNLLTHSLTLAPRGKPLILVNNPADSDSAYWQEEIFTMDAKSTQKYETFFGQNFTDVSLTSKQIGEELQELSQKTGKNPAAIWIWSNSDNLDVIMVTGRNRPIGQSITEANSASLDEAITEFMNEITDPAPLGIRNSTSYLSSAQKLYRWMIKPVESQLEAEKIDTLIVCVGPGLRTLPLGALHDGKSFLIEKYSIAMVPSFSLTDLSVSEKNGKEIQILAMGTANFEFLSALPGVPLELNNITPSPWNGVKIVEEEFTLDNLKSEREKIPFEIIHLATHAKFEPGEPKNSYIQLSDQKLTLAQLRELNWSNPPVALLVLSACQTAIGDKQAELGFAGLAVQSGVRSALGSYWSVSDAGTVALMTEFYQHLKSYQTKYNILFKAEALRDTQLSMIKNKVYVEQGQIRSTRGNLALPSELTGAGDDNLSHPYYWAAFTVIGSPW